MLGQIENSGSRSSVAAAVCNGERSAARYLWISFIPLHGRIGGVGRVNRYLPLAASLEEEHGELCAHLD